jgi:isocitrate dehydrogenase
MGQVIAVEDLAGDLAGDLAAAVVVWGVGVAPLVHLR